MTDQCISAVQRISIKEIKDFCWCPKYYELKQKDPNNFNLKEAYDISLHKCFYAYLLALQNREVKGIELLKQKWGKEWVKQKKNSQIIFTPSAMKRDTYDMKRKAGVDAILTFEEIMSSESQFPIIVNKPYEIQITDKIILTGVWEYVREIERNGKNVIQIIKFKTENNKFQVLHQVHHDLELTAAALAFEETFNHHGFEIVYFDIYKKKMIYSYRTKADYELLKKTVISTVQCLNNGIQCVSPDKKCYHCEYRDVCNDKI